MLFKKGLNRVSHGSWRHITVRSKSWFAPGLHAWSCCSWAGYYSNAAADERPYMCAPNVSNRHALRMLESTCTHATVYLEMG